MSLLRSIYRRPCVDHDGLRNPVDLWLAGGGKFHRKARRKISAPAEVLPCWRAGIEAEANNPAIRDALWFGLYTGMRRDEVLTLRWERVDMDALTFRVEETKTGVPLELPITNQLAAILERRRTAAADLPEGVRECVFPSPTSATGHVQDPHHLYARIGKAGGAKFWFHGLRNSFITVAERELMLPPSLTKRLVNHARPNDVTQGYAADWTIAQLRRARTEDRRSDPGADASFRGTVIHARGSQYRGSRHRSLTAAALGHGPTRSPSRLHPADAWNVKATSGENSTSNVPGPLDIDSPSSSNTVQETDAPVWPLHLPGPARRLSPCN